MTTTLSDAVQTFLKSKDAKYLGKTISVENLFIKKTDSNIGEGKSYAFLDQKAINFGNITLSSDKNAEIAQTLKDCIRAYTKDKNFAIKVYKSFLGFLKKNYASKLKLNSHRNFHQILIEKCI